MVHRAWRIGTGHGAWGKGLNLYGRGMLRPYYALHHAALPVPSALCVAPHSTISSLIESSLSWAGVTRDGASVIGQTAFCVLGNAITSRMDCMPVRMAVSRSRP